MSNAEIYAAKLAAQFAFCRIDRYHAAGYRGKGVRIINCENDANHGEDTTNVLQEVAPEAEILNCTVSTNQSSDGAEALFWKDGQAYTPLEFYQAFHPDIMTASLAGKKPIRDDALGKCLQPLIDNGVIFFNSVGNKDEDAQYGFFRGGAIMAGAVRFMNGDYAAPLVMAFSQDNPDFMAFEGSRCFGTSFASPFAAAMAALLMQAAGRKFNQDEIGLIFKKYARTIGTPERTGNGILIMPPVEGVKNLLINSKNIDDLRQDVAANCRIMLQMCKDAGLPVLVTGTYRDKEYQEYCYSIGTAKTKVPSFHGAGLAFDVCKNVKGHEYDDLDFFARCAEIGKKIGFEWGGDWRTIVDKPHFQWSGLNHEYTSAMVIAGKLPPIMPEYKEAKILTADEARAIIKTKAGLSDETIQFLWNYRYGDALLVKLAEAMK